MKIVIINKSDATGGAAIVSRRLMEALRVRGVDARMLVCEKLSDSPFVELAANSSLIKRKFLIERLKIFVANGFNRNTLFKIDSATNGLPLWKHPLVVEADAILINWVNQGMLSLNGIKKLLQLEKPVIWTMHDMWCLTGICHHAGTCDHYLLQCGNCHFLGKNSGSHDLSNKILLQKKNIYPRKPKDSNLAFVAVSHWLKKKAAESSLLKSQRVEVIPNLFEPYPILKNFRQGNIKVKILFGAARLDDPIKGLDTLKATTEILSTKYPEVAQNLELILFGNVKEPKSLENFGITAHHIGMIKGEEAIAKTYFDSDILVSASSYETLPGTLVEAQAYGCIPVSFNQGGQIDIVEHCVTGYIAPFDDDINKRADNLANGIVWAYQKINQPDSHERILREMRHNVETKFSPELISGKYLSLIQSLSQQS